MGSRAMTPREFRRWCGQTAARLETGVREAEEQSLQHAYELARELSGGRLNPADLAEMDHPYARRHGSPRLNPAMVNEQSGGFVSGWRKEPVVREGDSLVGVVHNVSDVAPYLEQKDPPPTRTTMFARPLAEAVLERVGPLREVRLAEAIRRAIEGA